VSHKTFIESPYPEFDVDTPADVRRLLSAASSTI